ncbi:MAG: FMN reductase [Micromonosporaceae bacterium]
MTSDEPRRVAVVTAGLSQPSSSRLLADRLAAAAERALEQRGSQVKTDVIELRTLARELVDNLLTGFPSERLRQAIDSVLAADALIAVTPIFAASYSGLFKVFFDVLEVDSLTGKPVLIGAAGGTERHSLALEHALRPLFGYLRATVVPTAVYAASSDWGAGEQGEALVRRIERAAGELAVAVGARGPVDRTDPFQEPTPFEQLLTDGQRSKA